MTVTVVNDRDEAIRIVSSAGTDELPISVEVLAEDGTIAETLTFPAAPDRRP